MKFIINASNIPNWLWAGLCFLCFNSFAYIFVVYISTHLLFCTYSVFSNRRKKAQYWHRTCHKIKPIALIIWLYRNFKLKYLRIILLLFHSILTSCAKSNTYVATGMMQNFSARYELTFSVLFYLLNN